MTRALVGGTVYTAPAAEPLDGAVLIRRGEIAAIGAQLDIPNDARIVDCRGCAITAGFWNSHVHFHERKWADVATTSASELEAQLQEITRYGFTSVFDLSSQWENTRRLRDRIESGEVRGPRIYSTGEGLLPLRGTPSAEVFRVLGLMQTKLFEVGTSLEARSAAKRLLEQGADGVKLFISSPSAGQLAPEIIAAAVEEAHAAGKPVFAHPNTATDIHAALEGGVDIIAHTTPRSGAWDEELLNRMKACSAALIPTLMVWQSMMRHDRISTREQLVETAVAQLRAWLEVGGTVLFGTDLGAVEYDPSDEYALMARAGATFDQVLASLTTTPARRFGAPFETRPFETRAARAPQGDTGGEIAVGMPADLVVLEGDPLQDVETLASVRYTLRAGEIIYASKERLRAKVKP